MSFLCNSDNAGNGLCKSTEFVVDENGFRTCSSCGAPAKDAEGSVSSFGPKHERVRRDTLPIRAALPSPVTCKKESFFEDTPPDGTRNLLEVNGDSDDERDSDDEGIAFGTEEADDDANTLSGVGGPTTRTGNEPDVVDLQAALMGSPGPSDNDLVGEDVETTGVFDMDALLDSVRAVGIDPKLLPVPWDEAFATANQPDTDVESDRSVVDLVNTDASSGAEAHVSGVERDDCVIFDQEKVDAILSGLDNGPGAGSPDEEIPPGQIFIGSAFSQNPPLKYDGTDIGQVHVEIAAEVEEFNSVESGGHDSNPPDDAPKAKTSMEKRTVNDNGFRLEISSGGTSSEKPETNVAGDRDTVVAEPPNKMQKVKGVEDKWFEQEPDDTKVEDVSDGGVLRWLVIGAVAIFLTVIAPLLTSKFAGDPPQQVRSYSSLSECVDARLVGFDKGVMERHFVAACKEHGYE